MSVFSSLEDSALLDQLRQDNVSAFKELYHRYWYKLFYVCHKRLRSTAVCEEIVQDVFTALWKNRTRLSIDNLSQYLAAMTRHALYHHLARESRKDQAQEGYIRNELADLPAMEDTIDNRMMLELVRKLADDLPEKCRLVFVYNKIEDRPLSEVAGMLNISTKTAEIHLTKALKRIRLNLARIFLFLF